LEGSKVRRLRRGHQASITVRSLLNARDPILASVQASLLMETSPEPVKHAPTTTSAPVIDWSRRAAPLTERFPQTSAHAPWAVDFLGVKDSQPDLGSLTGLRMKIPESPQGPDSI